MDLIDRMLRRLQHIEPTLDTRQLEILERAMRAEFGGIPNRPRKNRKTKKAEIEEQMQEGFRGDVRALAREMGVHRSTVYRVLGAMQRQAEK